MKALKIYAIIITVLFLISGILVWNFYSQAKITKMSLVATQNLLEQNKTELSNLRQFIAVSLVNIKQSTALLNDSLASFLVAGDVKIASISQVSANKISGDIQTVANDQDRVALEQGWNDFLKTKTVSNYLAFSRFLIQNIQNNLVNIK
ncbi:MAG TPA: hypothetical protein PLO44_02940 [Candidatus Paceibacterota bacterium]|nr:hypothetical protein [Candidatus Paceibacterota bacterium]